MIFAVVEDSRSQAEVLKVGSGDDASGVEESKAGLRVADPALPAGSIALTTSAWAALVSPAKLAVMLSTGVAEQTMMPASRRRQMVAGSLVVMVKSAVCTLVVTP